MVVALRIVLSQIFGEDVMAGGGKAVGAHTTVVTFFVSSLACRGKTNNHVARTDVRIVDDISTFHTAGDGGVDDDRPYQIAHVGRLTPCGIYADTHLTQFGQQLVRAVDDGRDYLTRDEHLIASDGTGNEDVVYGTDTEQVVGVHHNGILGDAFPYGKIASLFPVHVSQCRLGASAVGMHDVTVLRIATQNIGNNLTEGLWEDALVDVLDGVVYVFFGGTHAAHHISVLFHISYFSFSCQNSQLTKACRSSISSPFFTSAPCSAPLRINSVWSGL